ncbi:MAG: hypothetical protein BWX90_00166 [bacterium ADurb.Bin132]|nr:MAG: hypothetical protein BWX90_00166 [bacterium ADurb.Bin132]
MVFYCCYFFEFSPLGVDKYNPVIVLDKQTPFTKTKKIARICVLEVCFQAKNCCSRKHNTILINECTGVRLFVFEKFFGAFVCSANCQPIVVPGIGENPPVICQQYLLRVFSGGFSLAYLYVIDIASFQVDAGYESSIVIYEKYFTVTGITRMHVIAPFV